MTSHEWKTHNPDGGNRVVVTKNLPGDRWLRLLILADCRVEICTSTDVLSVEQIKAAIGSRCDAVIGQLTEAWGDTMFAALKAAGGRAYSNYAVGYNNVDVAAATRHGIPVGNTPGVLTETTAEMALALTFAAARRTGESERFLRAGKYQGWLPTLFLGKLLQGRTVGIVGAGRIGAAYGRMMVEGHKMHLKYYDLFPNPDLEAYIKDYGEFLKARGETPVSCERSDTLEDLLKKADCVSLHTVLDNSTHHLINAQRLSLMKPDAILINTSRGQIIDEAALVAHCRTHPDFRAGLDVFEDEPVLKPGLNELENVVLAPHIGSATSWTREGMAILAAANVAGILMGFQVWQQSDITPFLKENPPQATPSIINALALHLAGPHGATTDR
ncbi:MAG: NAD(P)-dependent oxidoreductase [Pseudomonadota bacterium]